MKLELLTDNFEAHKIVAKWYFDEWLSSIPGVTIEQIENKLAKATNRQSAPLIALAKDNGKLLGAASALTTWFFDNTEHEKLYGVSMEDNVGSKAVLKKIGMVSEKNVDLYNCEGLASYSPETPNA